VVFLFFEGTEIPMKPKTPKLIKFAGELLGRIKQARIPNLLSKFSKKIYGNHRLLILSILRQRLRRTYRELIEFLEVSKEMRDFIGLKRVPHFTTLQKFTKRAEPSWLELLLERKISEIIAVDSTGFEPGRASHYYLRRISGFSSRNYIKLSAVIETADQKVLGFRIHNTPVHDNKDFLPLIKDLKFCTVVADCAYDCEANHKFVHYKLGAKSVIPLRKAQGRRQGHFRRKLQEEFPEEIYHQRSKVESVFSVIKRKYGSALRSRSFASQKFELSARIIAYNIEREVMISLLEIIGFLQARPTPYSQKPEVM